MMKIRILITLLALLMAVPGVFAAKKLTPEQKKVESIKADTENYVFGEGYGEDPEDAYQAALYDMVRKISVNVTGHSTMEMSAEMAEDGSVASSEKFKSVVNSYTTPASLEGVQTISLGDGPEFIRFVYMPRFNIEKMHYRRQRNVANLAREGMRALKKGKVDDALRHLYRSYVLLQSLPNPSEVIEDVDGEMRTLNTWLPEEMNDIVHHVKFGIASVERDESDPESAGQTLELTVSYDGKPVTTCTFKYGTVSGYSPLITARDGMAMIEVDDNVPMNPLKLYVEYQFKAENHVDAELRPLLESFKGAGLVNNQIALNEGKKGLKADKKETRAFQNAVAAGAKEGIEALPAAEAAPYASAMARILQAIGSHQTRSVRDLFTDDGYRVFDKLMSYGKVRILGKATPDTYAFYPFRDEVMCRSVPMSFTFDGGQRKFTEDVIFTFNKDAKVESVTFGLGSIARNDIFAKEGAAWTDYRKMVLVNFLENYRTAFALRELDYIESIFDDDAVIIIGHVSKRLNKATSSDGGISLSNSDHVTYMQKSKQEYMEHLRRCFQAQEYINLRFSYTDVERSGVGGETYALQLKQDYVSKTYGDEGYLFLFVDFNDEDKPLIHIRTWQPERNPELTPNLPPGHPRAGIFSPASF